MCGVGDLLGILLVLYKEDIFLGWFVNVLENLFYFIWLDCYFFIVCFVYLEKLRLVSIFFNVILIFYGIVYGINRLFNEFVVIIYCYDFKNLLYVVKIYGLVLVYVYYVG